MTDSLLKLEGQLLAAMPGITDPRFEKAVILVCAHSKEGAMGLVINKPLDTVTFSDLLKQLKLNTEIVNDTTKIYFGGPVETTRGFILHTSDYHTDATLKINDTFSLTANLDVVKSIALGTGPNASILALGYAGWAPGQLDEELQNNGWLTIPATQELVFSVKDISKWGQAGAAIGIDISSLSIESGRA